MDNYIDCNNTTSIVFRGRTITFKCVGRAGHVNVHYSIGGAEWDNYSIDDATRTPMKNGFRLGAVEPHPFIERYTRLDVCNLCNGTIDYITHNNMPILKG